MVVSVLRSAVTRVGVAGFDGLLVYSCTGGVCAEICHAARAQLLVVGTQIEGVCFASSSSLPSQRRTAKKQERGKRGQAD
jgi:hypothetical protein